MKFVPTLATALGFASALLTASLFAQNSIYAEQGKLIRASESVATLGPDLFGDQANLYMGALAFQQTDVSLPGNNALPVRVGRTFKAHRGILNGQMVGSQLGMFEDWDLDIPHLHGIFHSPNTTSSGWQTLSGTAPFGPTNSRCTEFGPPLDVIDANGAGWSATEYWNGTFLSVPGSGDQEIMVRTAQNSLSPTNAAYPLVTKSNWAFRCIPLAVGTGEGFLAVAPDGTEYKFDTLVFRKHPSITKSSAAPAAAANPQNVPSAFVATAAAVNTYILTRNEVWITPSTVTDRFGNSVTYAYDAIDPWKVKSITSSDGRALTFAYSLDPAALRRVTSVTDGTRTWSYGYSGALDLSTLSTVTLPDNSNWGFKLGALKQSAVVHTIRPACNQPGVLNVTPLIANMTHPSGASGSFTVTPTPHGRSLVDLQCIGGSLGGTDGSYAYHNIYFDTYSLTNKTISGPGLPSMTWTYAWGPANASFTSGYLNIPASACVAASNCPITKTVTVTDPRGDMTRYTFGNQYFVNEGQLLQVDSGWNGASALRTTKMRYRAPLSLIGPAAPYPPQAGLSQQPRGDGEMASTYAPEDQRIITQQAVDFKWEAAAGAAGFDFFARPISVTRSSALGSRTEKTTYEDNTAKWVLGQVKSMTETNTNKVMVENGYNATTANLETVKHFGRTEQMMAWNADGTLLTRTDGQGQTTTFNNYKRGLAQSATYADAKSESAVVNNIGNIDSVTDPLGNITSYDYDAMGRLRLITRPTGDTAAWNTTTLTFQAVAGDEYGIASGHWRQTVTTGNATTIQYFDGLWRPLLTRTYDAASEATTARMVRRDFEFTGRATFESYPQRSIASVTSAVVGTTSSYDALGRLQQKQASSELGTLTTSYDYLGDFQKRMTDARRNLTTTSYQAFDEPSEGAPTSISAPEGVTVAILRDVFGKAKSITRSGPGASATRSYVYDDFERLCKTIEPEVGATIQDYDGANNVSWRAIAATLTSPACDRSSVTATSKTSFIYDPRNRLLTSTFGDGSPSIVRTYHGDGLPDTITSADSTWTYSYNKRRLLTKEKVVIGVP